MAARCQGRAAAGRRYSQHCAGAGLRIPGHDARDGGRLVGRCLRECAVGALRGDRQHRHSAHDVPHDAEICQGLPLLGRVRHRQAPLYLAHAVRPALWRLGRARCAQDEPVAGAQQVHRHSQSFLHQQPVGCDCTHSRQGSGRRPLHGFEPQGGRCLLQRIYGRQRQGKGRVPDRLCAAAVPEHLPRECPRQGCRKPCAAR